jgi:hypothetical protein
MADDPMTLTFVKQTNLAPGLVRVVYLAAGPADYDATNGAAMDVSTYFQTIDNVTFGACTAKADALICTPKYVNDDFSDADGGAVYFTWDSATAAAAVLDNVTDTTDLSGYEWRVIVEGTMVTRT